MKKTFYIIGATLLLLFSKTVFGQSLEGKTTDSAHRPIEGVSVFKNKENISFITDSQGFFKIEELMKGDTLHFKHISYQDTFIVIQDPSKILQVSLKNSGHLIDEVEVVTTGYQRIPRERSTGSFSVIENEQISEQINFNIIDRIPAVASGVILDRNIGTGSSSQLLVRGMSTIMGEVHPLIVLDNFPYEGNLENINPDDIEEITILKDAAAASIWGARAGNGVIVITSKKTQKNQEMRVNVNSITSVEEKPDLFSLDRISSSDMIDVETLLFEEGYYDSRINLTSKTVLSPAVELLMEKKSLSDPNEIEKINKELDRLKTLDVRNDFLKYLYRLGARQQSSLALSKGSENFMWNASAGLANLKDNLNSRTNRNTFLWNSRVNVLKKLVLDAGINISFLKTRSGRPGFGSVSSYNEGLFPYAEFADDKGNPLPVYKDWQADYLQKEIHPELLDWTYYPLEDYKHHIQTQRNQSTILSAGLEYQFPKWVTASFKYQFQRQTGFSENLRHPESYEARNLVNGYAEENSATGGINFEIPKGGLVDFGNNDLRAHNLRGQLDFDNNGDLHRIYAILGTEVRDVLTNSKSHRLYGYNPDNLSYSPLDLTVPYKHYITGANTFLSDGIALNQRRNRYISTFFNGAYTLFSKYTASLSARRDASNLFGLNVKDKWNPFWSVGAAWIISNEDFWPGETIGFLKLRATAGKTGNVNPSMVALTTIRYVGPNPYTQSPYARFDNYANPELKWETVGMTNIALDFSTKNNRISGTIERFWKNGDNLYGISPIDYTTGVDAFIVKNVASMRASGFDLILNTLNTTGKIKWRSNLNLNLNNDKITKYHMENELASNFVSPINRISGREGSPVYSMYSYKWQGLDKNDGAPLGLLEGEPSREYLMFTGGNASVEDLVYHGSVLPKVFGSLGNTISWKDWSMMFRVTFKFDYYFRRETISYNSLFSTWKGHGDFNKRWQKRGDENHTDIPGLMYPIPFGLENFYPFAEPFVERGDHVRLEFINLSYNLPTSGKYTQWFKQTSVALNINNLGLIYRKNNKKIDPDYSSFSHTDLSPSTIYSLNLKFAL